MVAWVTAVAWVQPLGPVLLPASEAAKIKKNNIECISWRSWRLNKAARIRTIQPLNLNFAQIL